MRSGAQPRCCNAHKGEPQHQHGVGVKPAADSDHLALWALVALVTEHRPGSQDGRETDGF